MPNRSRVTMSYTEDARGVSAILCGPEMRAALLAVVEEGKKVAETIAPRRSGLYASNFRTSVSTRTDTGGKYPGLRRGQADLENVTPYAASLEWGTADGPGRGGGARPQRILGRTQDALRATGT